MFRQLCKATGIKNNYRTMSPPKDYNKSVLTGPKEMKIQGFSNRKFKEIVLDAQKAIREHRSNSIQYQEFQNKIRCSKKRQKTKQKRTKQILELESIMSELKIQYKASTSDLTKQKRISELNDRSFENTH